MQDRPEFVGESLMTDIVMLHIQLILIFLAIVLLILYLKKKGVFSDDYREVFDRLVTELVFPVVIFSGLLTRDFSFEWIFQSAILMVAIFLCGIIAYAGCRFLGLSRKKTGTIVLISSFGSTTTFSAPLVGAYYGTQSMAFSEVMIEGLVGVAVPFSLFGILVAAYFGRDEGSCESFYDVFKKFLISPVLIALILGIIISVILPVAFPEAKAIFDGLFVGVFSVIGESLELLILASLAFMLKPQGLREILSLTLLVFSVKMILQPLFVIFGAGLAGFSEVSCGILLLLALAPSGAIALVYADRYGCDGSLGAEIVIATYLLSMLTFPLAAGFLL